VPAAYPGASCVGEASLQASAIGPVIVFADGSRLEWDSTLPSTMQPYVGNAAAGDKVWIDYQKRNIVICPFCGAYTTNTLQIRDGQAGRIRFYAQQGDVLPNLTDAQINELFGVPATALQTCTFPAFAGCSSYLRSQFDHQLATVPPQLIVDATLTTVAAPNGHFAVIWASSQESYVEQVPNCEDGPGLATDTGFTATLLPF